MGQHKMKENLEAGMAMVHESYHILDKGILSLQDETSEIEKKIGVVGETMAILQQFTTFGREKQEGLLQSQEKIQRAHDHLVENSQTILEAQEAFEQKQSSMFVALDRLFALQDALLVETRSMKAVVFYFISMLAIYMLTSTNSMPCIHARICSPSTCNKGNRTTDSVGDYERLYYNMLQKLTEEVISLRKNAELSWESDDESDWSALVDKDVSGDIF
ncbi:protein GAMETE EXPRESSED 1-like [Malus domestica]|uniref:protein GAMETE EXPRESSED 1-like n=1 Tax=Malus domestica TaxID=3750 RepID=UPI000498ACC3|nr:protein GAMETE EXPRESSED 1-like [Malus domestica]